MFLLSLGCRIVQFVFNCAALPLPWRKAITVEGAGSINRIPELLASCKAAKPLVVTDPGLVKAGIVSRVQSVLDKAGIPYALYSEVEPNPSVNTVNKIVEVYRSGLCDAFIAIGGGSAMDAAKGAAARLVRPRRSVNQLKGLFKVRRKIAPFIAIPTTAGTGSETTIAALITDTETHHKCAIMDLCLVPRYAVLDSELSAGLPPAITAATGMDALTHAVESYLCWTISTKESRRFALEAAKTIFENLEKVYRDGSNLEARQAMLKASYKAGFSFTRAGVGNIHAIVHALGGLYGTPHGLANAVIMPIVLEDYGKAVYKKLAKLAECAGVAEASRTVEQKAKLFIDAIYQMNERMGIPKNFDFIKDEDIDQMAKWAAHESNPLYPVPVVWDRKHFKRVIEQVRKGRAVFKPL